MLSFGFDFRNVNLQCDCKMQPFLEMAGEAIGKIWREYFNVTCASPPALQGQSIVDLLKEKQLNKFVKLNGRNAPDPSAISKLLGCQLLKHSLENIARVSSIRS
jgi:hypothetical protein